jgi:prevent-host-death family protein
MIKEATAMTVRQNLGELLNGIQYGRDQVVITKGGKPVAAMVDAALFEKICLMKREFTRLTDELAAACEAVDTALVQKEIDTAVRSVRKARAR